MARPKKEVKQEEVKSPKITQEAKDLISVQKEYKENEAITNKAILDANDSEKQKKDVLLMKTKDLEAHVEYLNRTLNDLNTEYMSRRKLVDGINGSIAGAQQELQNVRSNIEKQQAKVFEEIARRQKELSEADVTLRKLIAENEALITANRIKEGSLIEERQNCYLKVSEMEKALRENNSEWSKREADILMREKALEDERVIFEAEKASIQPDLMNISAIKNENVLLLQEIASGKKQIENLQLGLQADRQRMEEEKVADRANVRALEASLANEEKRLRQWQEQLNDLKLEAEAKSAEADRVMRRYQLQSKIDGK